MRNYWQLKAASLAATASEHVEVTAWGDETRDQARQRIARTWARECAAYRRITRRAAKTRRYQRLMDSQSRKPGNAERTRLAEAEAWLANAVYGDWPDLIIGRSVGFPSVFC